MITLEDLQNGVRFVIESLEALTSIKLAVGGAFSVEVKVVTRLGAIPVRGVKVTVGDEDFGSSDRDGLFKRNGVPWRKELDIKELDIKATYEKATEHLKRETVTIKLTSINHAAGTQKCSATYEVPKVQDVAGTDLDLDFKTVSDGTSELAWSDSDGTRLLTVTIKLSTLLLQVPYLSQKMGNDTVETIPGAATGKDPEATSHAIKGPSADGKFHGYNLCYPTSVTMLLNYWGVTKVRHEVMQKAYEQWADSGFSGRLDKLATTVTAATPPANPTQGEYWLDSSTDDGGFKMKRAQLAAGVLTWTVIAEDWRLDDAGNKIWEYAGRMKTVIDGLKPAGSTATLAPAPATAEHPLTKVEAGDGALPPDVLANYKTWLKSGWPFILHTTATGGHIMLARGVLVNKDEEIEWLIVNDPYGNLAYPGTTANAASYQTAEANVTGATGDTAMKGKAAYYHNKTLGANNKLRIKGGGRGFPRIEKPPINAAEIAAKLVEGT